MSESSEIHPIINDTITWCLQHLFKILSMPLRVILYTRIGERQLTGNILPYVLGLALLVFVGNQENSVLFPDWYPNLPFVVCLGSLSVGMWVFQYWEIQYFHTTNPKKVWPTSSIGVPRFFYEPGPIPQRWSQPLVILGIGCLYYLFSGSTAILLYFSAAAFGLWADYTIIIRKQHNLYLDEMDSGLSSGELTDSSFEVIPQIPHETPELNDVSSVPVALDNRKAFRDSLKRAQALFGHVPGDPAAQNPTSSQS